MGSPRADRALLRKMNMHEIKKDWSRSFDTINGIKRTAYIHKDGTIKTVWAPSTCKDMIQRHLDGGGSEDSFWLKMSKWLGDNTDQGEMIAAWANDCFLAVEQEWAQTQTEPIIDLFAQDDTPDLFGE